MAIQKQPIIGGPPQPVSGRPIMKDQFNRKNTTTATGNLQTMPRDFSGGLGTPRLSNPVAERLSRRNETTGPRSIGAIDDSRLNSINTANGVGAATNLRPVNDPEDVLGDVADRDWQTYRQNYQGLIDDLIGASQSTDIIDSTRERLSGLGGRMRGTNARNDSRTLASMTPAQRAALNRRSSFSVAETKTSGINNARTTQAEVNQNRRQELISTALNSAQAGAQGLGQAAGMQAGRENAYANAKTQQRNQNIQTGASLAALAIMMM